MLAPGTILQNRYRIVNLIGKGGMGAVYEAKAEHLKCTVAVKEAFFDDDELRKAFEREAQLLAGFRHSALPKVMDHFAENGKHYLVMEFIEGNDLGRMLTLRGEAFPIDQVLRWADELLGALEYLHARKIIHRDIKPANLKLTETGDLVLLDFGLAKGQHSQWSRVTGTSGESLKAYTPGYAPVEQVNGTGTDERSDLFAVGATLYHMLAGRPPVDAMTRGMSVLSGGSDLLRPPTEFNPRISAAVEKVLLQSLALNREQRPASAAEVRRQLREACSVAPIAEKPPEKLAKPLDEKQTAPMLAETRPADSVRAFEATKPAVTQPAPTPPPRPREHLPTQPVRPSPMPVGMLKSPLWKIKNIYLFILISGMCIGFLNSLIWLLFRSEEALFIIGLSLILMSIHFGYKHPELKWKIGFFISISHALGFFLFMFIRSK